MSSFVGDDRPYTSHVLVGFSFFDKTVLLWYCSLRFRYVISFIIFFHDQFHYYIFMLEFYKLWNDKSMEVYIEQTWNEDNFHIYIQSPERFEVRIIMDEMILYFLNWVS